ncbi:MAG: type I DNA topoisomerase [Desulfarculaceae bacterium]|nr:type I DNA topoisomerase [Desulfarculaceae bacterium]MCF8074080.1 type I DNA topoisomerase [Desulfarculaceae bacterium]MCF8102082.1 type I DNA topoisomerase [Desulfarculaceae bacterium]MCF8118120.1 type I DNA topoisomerase [Desulfarculaceae bacterium]
MAKNLLIVESPAKARTIKKYLGKDFAVKASVGHVVDLPKKRLGVDLDGDFTPEYQVIPGKEKVVRELKKAAKQADDVFLAPDPDREGEAIAMHIAQELGRPMDSYHRVLFHELTKDAIIKAVEQPSALNHDRYDSQQARRVLDRLVGYQISPLLWDKVRGGLSAGRVQSVALRLIVERERAIQAFQPQEYWTVTAKLSDGNPPIFDAKLIKVDGKKFAPVNQAEAEAGVAAISGQDFVVSQVKKRQVKRRPAPPFITSTLQQEAYRKLGFTTKKTMSLAQRLYEGKETDEGAVGLITYMRTDSTRLAPPAMDEARQLIGGRYGADYLPAKPNVYKSRSGAQDAHEAVRPTSAARTPEAMSKYLSADELKLYRLIWQRFIASQMAPALFDRTQAEIAAGAGLLRANGQIKTFPGFTAVYEEGKDSGDEPEQEGMLPPLDQGQELKLEGVDPKQHFTQPPPRFSEASLVKELEEKGIGRPSTYSSIISTLVDRKYVKKLKRQLAPTEMGNVVSDLLVESFPQIMEVDFTAQLEQSLDQVEEGKRDWRKLLGEFYGPFAQALEEAKTGMRQVKGKGLATDVDCPTCGKKMAIKLGKHGEFLACSGYPECKTTFDFTRDENGNIVPEAPPEDPGIACEKCGSPMAVKKGRYGPFLACSAYPKCKHVLPLDQDGQVAEKPALEPLDEKCPKCGGQLVIKPTRSGGRFISCSNYPKCRFSKGLPVGVDCPKCGHEIVEKRSRRGKNFYGCDNYPKCDYATWKKPIPTPCTSCGHPFVVEKKGGGATCPECKTDQD